MNENDINVKVGEMAMAMIADDKDAIRAALIQLGANFLVNQQRIADALETLAECVDNGNGGAYPKLRTSE
jgi:hypothetical protein